jgi:hypothetical protein
MITRRGTLEDVNEAMRAMKAGEISRSVLILDEDAVPAERVTGTRVRR